MSEPSEHTTEHANEAVAPASPAEKPTLALPAPSDADENHTQLEVNGQAFSLYDRMGPTVVNSDGVRLLFLEPKRAHPRATALAMFFEDLP